MAKPLKQGNRRRAVHTLLVLFAGCGLFYCGWSAPRSVTELAPGPRRLVVRPTSASVEGAPDDLTSLPGKGRYQLGDGQQTLVVRAEGWKDKPVPPEQRHQVTAVRARPEPVRLEFELSKVKELEVFKLPSKEKLNLEESAVLLHPGRYTLLLKSRSHLPKTVDLVVEPGKNQNVKAALQEIPVPKRPSPPRGTPPLSAPPVYRPPVRPAPPLPPSRPRPRPAPPRPQPRPRFTPVAPLPPPSQPAPVFTPLP